MASLALETLAFPPKSFLFVVVSFLVKKVCKLSQKKYPTKHILYRKQWLQLSFNWGNQISITCSSPTIKVRSKIQTSISVIFIFIHFNPKESLQTSLMGVVFFAQHLHFTYLEFSMHNEIVNLDSRRFPGCLTLDLKLLSPLGNKLLSAALWIKCPRASLNNSTY